MKNFKNMLLIIGIVSFLVSCESDNDAYSGTPVGNQDIVTIEAVISTPLTKVMTSQKIPFTVQLPRTFVDTVAVEVSALNQSGTRTRRSFDIPPGQTVGNDTIVSSGAVVYESTVDIYVSAIALRHTEPGKHYLAKSNVVTLQAGSLSVPSDNGSKLQMRFGWLKPSKIMNSFSLYVDRPNVMSYTSAPGASTAHAGTASSSTITVNSTDGLSRGMVVTVSSGSGNFGTNNTITAITSPTTFTVSIPVTYANRLQNNAVVTAGGMDKVVTGATSVYNVNPDTGANVLSNIVNVDSSVGLYAGMAITVTGGTGNFRAGTTIVQVVSPTQIRVSAIPLGSGGVALVNATFVAVFPDLQYAVGEGTQTHDIATLMAGMSSTTSIQQGEYFIKLIPSTVLESGADIPYRMLWKFPDGSVQFYESVFQNVTTSSPSKNILKVTKTGEGTAARFTVTGL